MSKLDHAEWFDYLHQIEDDIDSGVIDVTPYLNENWRVERFGVAQLPDYHPAIIKLHKMVEDYHKQKDIEKAIRLFNEGNSIAYCARFTSSTQAEVQNILEEHGIEWEQVVQKSTVAYTPLKVIKYIENDFSKEEMSELFGMTVEELEQNINQHINKLQEVF